MFVQLKPTLSARAQAIDDVLPQTQCRQCGYQGCAAYAEAIAQGQAPINQCAPGGQAGIEKLAQLLQVPVVPLNPEYGHEMPFAVARIRAGECIGCMWCTRACPTDAVVGAPKHLHAILEVRCTGCGLCAPACPMDCIDFVEVDRVWGVDEARQARRDYQETQARRARLAAQEEAQLAAKRAPTPSAMDKKDFMAQVFAKARMKSPTPR